MKFKKYLRNQSKMKISEKRSLYIFVLCFLTIGFNGTLPAKNKDKTIEVNVLTFKKSSKTGHEMIQKAIDYASANNINTVIIPDGEYQIDATLLKGITLKSNIHLKLEKNAVLKAIPSDSTHYNIVRIENVENVKISGGKILGERFEHKGKGGEWGHGLNIRNAVNLELKDISINDCWGDAIYITGTSKDISISNIICDNNRRQGISVIAVNGLIIKESTFKNTHGTGPAAGIDLEPNNSNEVVQNVLIENCRFTNNTLGIHMYGRRGPSINIKAINCLVDSNIIGVSLRYEGVNQVELSNIKISNSKDQGLRVFDGSKDVRMSQITITGSLKNAITIADATNVELSDFTVVNYLEGLLIKDSNQIKLKSFNFKTDSKTANNVDISKSNNVSMIDFDIN